MQVHEAIPYVDEAIACIREDQAERAAELLRLVTLFKRQCPYRGRTNPVDIIKSMIGRIESVFLPLTPSTKADTLERLENARDTLQFVVARAHVADDAAQDTTDTPNIDEAALLAQAGNKHIKITDFNMLMAALVAKDKQREMAVRQAEQDKLTPTDLQVAAKTRPPKLLDDFADPSKQRVRMIQEIRDSGILSCPDTQGRLDPSMFLPIIAPVACTFAVKPPNLDLASAACRVKYHTNTGWYFFDEQMLFALPTHVMGDVSFAEAIAFIKASAPVVDVTETAQNRVTSIPRYPYVRLFWMMPKQTYQVIGPLSVTRWTLPFPDQKDPTL